MSARPPGEPRGGRTSDRRAAPQSEFLLLTVQSERNGYGGVRGLNMMIVNVAAMSNGATGFDLIDGSMMIDSRASDNNIGAG